MRQRITIRDHTAEANLFARRSVIALVIVAVMISMILSNLYYLQIERFEDYQTRSNGNRIKVLPVAPNRGLVYDRNGVLLAENRPIFSLEVVPEQVDNLDDTLAQVQALLNIDQENIDDFYKQYRGQRRFKPITLKNNLNEQDVAVFSASQHKYPGVSVEARLTRHYPFGETLTHLLGYVSRINKKDLQKLTEAGQQENYAATHDIGKLGIEKYHESLLHGEVGYQEVEVNNQGRIVRTLSFEPPVPGQDLVLNIDIQLQQAVQESLQDKRGTVVVLDTNDGGVLALYSNPSYDPNLFVNGISQKDYSALLNSDAKPLINRATQGQYPPASTVKPHLALLGLEEEVIKADTRFFDRGFFQLKNVEHRWRDHVSWGHGWLDVVKAIQVSCDTFFYDLAYRLGIDRISDMMYRFGFGEYTGIDLYEESDANMPSRGWKRARFNQPWYIGDTISVGIGQGYWTATPLQLTQSISTLVNRGERYVPQILRGRLIEGNTLLFEPKTLAPIQLKNPQNWDTALDAMIGTVSEEHGSGYRSFNSANYTSGGKTGTAQLFKIGKDEEYEEEKVAANLRDNAMYVGFAPAEAPQLAITVVLENAGFGSKSAAPIARQVMDTYFELKTPVIARQDSDVTARETRTQ